ncbi:hypothetical protein J3P96_07670 [Pseudomonas sp. R3-56]|uniref:hypothetical protein n=1 Tax=Pseudomonas sp. R3-56 TaxID=2817401 RepID=UPI003DA91992
MGHIQFFIILLIGVGSAGCGTVENATNAAGTIFIREKDISKECSVPATPGDHVISNYDCTNDQAYTVRLYDIPSAVNITFFDDKNSDGCLDGEGWEIEVRTIKNPTTTPQEPRMSLSAMYSQPNGEIIEPGVLKIRSRNGGDVSGKLSCVRVENDK